MSSNDEVDGWVAQLMQCKPLSEAEVKKLCDKVGWKFACYRQGAEEQFKAWSGHGIGNGGMNEEEEGDKQGALDTVGLQEIGQSCNLAPVLWSTSLSEIRADNRSRCRQEKC